MRSTWSTLVVCDHMKSDGAAHTENTCVMGFNHLYRHRPLVSRISVSLIYSMGIRTSGTWALFDKWDTHCRGCAASTGSAPPADEPIVSSVNEWGREGKEWQTDRRRKPGMMRVTQAQPARARPVTSNLARFLRGRNLFNRVGLHIRLALQCRYEGRSPCVPVTWIRRTRTHMVHGDGTSRTPGAGDGKCGNNNKEHRIATRTTALSRLWTGRRAVLTLTTPTAPLAVVKKRTTRSVGLRNSNPNVALIHALLYNWV